MIGAEAEDVGARLSFDRGAPGRWAVGVPRWEGASHPLPPAKVLRDSVRLPEWSQPELVRYYTMLSRRNYGIDTGPYPLGSCTMKYNPKLHDQLIALPGFAEMHPLAPAEDAQGLLVALWSLQTALGTITGLPAVSLAPAAGAQGELAGILMIRRALEARGDLAQRRRVLVPDSAHGTNPATATMAGFQVTQIPTDADGSLNFKALEAALDDTVAAIMVTIPNTLGLWERRCEDVVTCVHEAGAFAYGDGANLNAIVGRLRFADLGVDVVHLNLHKTFSTPHGGGGPGAGPVCATEALAQYLPAPVVVRGEDGLFLSMRPEESIGQMQQFHGNVGVLLRALAYIRTLGLDGLRAVSGTATLNANYLRALIHDHYESGYDRPVLHEVVLSGARMRREHDIHTYDVAKRLIDYGFHPPTVYFPLIVEEALMIEPTETESREGVEAFAEALIAIAEEVRQTPELLRSAPHDAPVGRMDEVNAARHPDLRWQPSADPSAAAHRSA